ncbi:MAG: PAS domain S-box protein [Desulfobacterales bacterium]|nr:PAS domain S-box protein [Desulfobacterales bacterium]
MENNPTYEELQKKVKALEQEAERRKQAEVALRHSEHRIQQYLAMAGVMFVALDDAGNITLINDCSLEVLGYRREELLGENWFKTCLPQALQEDVLAVYHQLMQGEIEPVEHYENSILRKGGEERIIAWHNTVLQDPAGKTVGVLSSGEDITARKQMDAALKKSEAKYRSSLENTEKIIANLPIGMVIVGKDKIIKRINKAALALMGYESEKQIIGTICHKSICPAEKGRCPILDLRQVVDQSEKVVIHKEGRHIPVYKTALPMEIDGRAVVLETFMDIRPLKTAEKALRENEERLHTVMETIVDPVVVYDSQGRATYLNPAFTRVFGWHPDELIGRKIDFVPEEAKPATHKAITRILKGEHLTSFETQRYTKDGRTIDARQGAALLKNAVGQPQGMVVNFQDITREKQAEDELKTVNRELIKAIEHANAMALEAELASVAKSEFLANMSHEIRTPMNGVIGMTGLLLDTELTDEQRKYAGVLRASGESLLSLINDILDFSKIEAGKLELEILDFDLRITLEDMVEVLAVNAHEKGLELTALVDPQVPSLLRGDPGRLRQIIVNLAGNAIKFTHAGEVAIRADLEKESDQDVMVRFSVTDTGIGIPSSRLDALFSAFTQVDGSTTRKYGGTGLGLSISKQLVEVMDGEIGLESRENEGSTFWFTARFEKQAEGDLAPAAPAVDIRNVRVLVVDDHETNRLLVRTLLHSWGCRYAEAVDGTVALKKLNVGIQNSDPFQIALLDMQMPGMDGKELGRRIKANPQIRETVLIMMTSLGQRGDAKQLQKAGFAAYLSKPIRQAHLRDCLALALGIKSDDAGATEAAIITRHTLSEVQKRRARILLAEDNATNQAVALAILKKMGYRADAVANGKEALAALKTLPYDLVLMDCQMPELDGYETTRRIRQGRGGVENPDVTVIAMTANAMKGDREKCLEAGMNDYIAKPVDPQVIANVLERWLRDAVKKPAVEGETAEEGPGTQTEQDASEGTFVFEKAAFMERLMDDEELAQIVISGFIEDIPRQIQALKDYLASGDVSAVERQAHTIKGAAANVGGEALRAVAFEIEKDVQAGQLEASAARMTELEDQFGRLRAAMQTM